MNAMNISPTHLVWALVAAPVVVFALYISWLIVPEIVRVVVPEVVHAVFDIFK